MSTTMYDKLSPIFSAYADKINQNASDITELNTSLDNLNPLIEIEGWLDNSYVITKNATVDITEVLESTDYACIILEVTAGDNYVITAHGGFGPRAWCVTNSSGTVLSVAAQGVTVTDYSLTIPTNGAYLIVNAFKDMDYYVKEGKPLRQTVMDMDDKMNNLFSDVIVVRADGSGDYATINAAFTAASEGDTILVYPGEYAVSTIRAFEKEITIIGTDPRECILYNTNGLRANPVLETGAGRFENLTLYSKYISGTSNELSSTTSGAYAVHIEGQEDSGYAVGKKVIFRNCILKSDFAPALGVGASKDWSLILDNCELIINQASGFGTHTEVGSYGALYFHDAAGNAARGATELVVKNCTFRNKTLSNAMCIYAVSSDDSNNVNALFINNVLYSDASGVGQNAPIYWVEFTPWGRDIHRDGMSYGNNNSELNG